jgi:NADH-quinone oxidoreductase subunit N
VIAFLARVSQPLPDDPEPIARPDVDWAALAPVLILAGGALLLMLLVALIRRRLPSGLYTLITCATALGVIGAAIPLWRRVTDAERGPSATLNEAIVIDGFSVYAIVTLAAAVVITALFVDGYLRREGLEGVEAHVLLLFSAAGGVVLVQANDLIVLFLGLEVLSIAVYVIAAMHARRFTSQEAGMKYLVLGAFSSSFLLYGIALIYGATGTTNLGRIMDLFSANLLTDDGLVLAGLALLLVGLGFKVSAVPFQFWTPDVYQGAPTPMVAWMASGVKVAGFAALIRVFMLAFQAYSVDWQPLIYALAVATLLVGSVLAVVQTNVKRMLAYSSIAHAGYVLVGVQAATSQGVESALFYLATYTFMVAGSFGIVSLVGRTGDRRHSLDDYRDLGQAQPALALLLAIFLFAQAGVPLTSGFFAKFYVISAAVDAGSWHLGAVAMLAAVIAAYLYLRIVVSMYMSDSYEEAGEARISATPAPGILAIRTPAAAGLALFVCVVVTIGLGVWPGAITDITAEAIPVLVAPG